MLIPNIIFQSDWWLHIIASLFLWGVLYLIETKLLKKNFKSKAALAQLLLSNLIDLDHLLSFPVFESGRCSINNHILHSAYMFPLYLLGVFTRYRYFFLGLILHLLIDGAGCLY